MYTVGIGCSQFNEWFRAFKQQNMSISAKTLDEKMDFTNTPLTCFLTIYTEICFMSVVGTNNTFPKNFVRGQKL